MHFSNWIVQEAQLAQTEQNGDICKGKDDLLLIPQNEGVLLSDRQEWEIREDDDYFKKGICPFIDCL